MEVPEPVFTNEREINLRVENNTSKNYVLGEIVSSDFSALARLKAGEVSTVNIAFGEPVREFRNQFGRVVHQAYGPTVDFHDPLNGEEVYRISFLVRDSIMSSYIDFKATLLKVKENKIVATDETEISKIDFTKSTIEEAVLRVYLRLTEKDGKVNASIDLAVGL